MLCAIYAEFRKQSLYAECHYVKWHYAECRGAYLFWPKMWIYLKIADQEIGGKDCRKDLH
jgi:hypothetical protein